MDADIFADTEGSYILNFVVKQGMRQFRPAFDVREVTSSSLVSSTK